MEPSIVVTTAPSALSQAFLIGRGGATILAATGAGSLLKPLFDRATSRGDKGNVDADAVQDVEAKVSTEAKEAEERAKAKEAELKQKALEAAKAKEAELKEKAKQEAAKLKAKEAAAKKLAKEAEELAKAKAKEAEEKARAKEAELKQKAEEAAKGAKEKAKEMELKEKAKVAEAAALAKEKEAEMKEKAKQEAEKLKAKEAEAKKLAKEAAEKEKTKIKEAAALAKEKEAEMQEKAKQEAEMLKAKEAEAKKLAKEAAEKEKAKIKEAAALAKAKEVELKEKARAEQVEAKRLAKEAAEKAKAKEAEEKAKVKEAAQKAAAEVKAKEIELKEKAKQESAKVKAEAIAARKSANARITVGTDNKTIGLIAGAALAALASSNLMESGPLAISSSPVPEFIEAAPVPIKIEEPPKKKLWTEKGKSVLYMATGMAMHYLGYSLARSITVALFTSSSTGYADSPGAFPFAMAFVSPISFLLLVGYGRILDNHGPRGALNRTTILCAAVIALCAAGIEVSERTGSLIFGIPIMKYITGPLFVFRESYVQLLTSQYWSFMASVMTPDQSAKWFAPISGLTSIASAIGGVAVSDLVDLLNLAGALGCTSLALLLSLIATNKAYTIAEEGGFSPKEKPRKHLKKIKRGETKVGLIEKATKLFARVPVLRALFLEILASQSLATLLNVVFVSSLGSTIPDDEERAGWVGRFYALINIFSMTLQFGVLPLLMQIIEPKNLWRTIPIFTLITTSYQAIQSNPSLYIVSATLLTMKVLEYSARRMLDEMVYVPLDFESKFVGKEIIGVFGYRLGKSFMSLSLSALTSVFGDFGVRELSILSDVAAVIWTATAWKLSSLVPTRKEAQERYDQTTKVGQ